MFAVINYYTTPPIYGFTKMNGPINSETNISVWQLCANIHYWREEFNQFTFICVCSLGQLSAANNVNNSHKCSSDLWKKKWLSQFQMKIYKFIAKVNLIMLFELGTDKSNKKPNTMKSCKTGLPANFTHNHQKTHLIYSQVFFFCVRFVLFQSIRKSWWYFIVFYRKSFMAFKMAVWYFVLVLLELWRYSSSWGILFHRFSRKMVCGYNCGKTCILNIISKMCGRERIFSHWFFSYNNDNNWKFI